MAHRHITSNDQSKYTPKKVHDKNVRLFRNFMTDIKIIELSILKDKIIVLDEKQLKQTGCVLKSNKFIGKPMLRQL